MTLEDRRVLSAISDAAYPLLAQRVTANQESFFVYENGDSGFNHGFPSGYFAGDASSPVRQDLIAKIQLDAAAVNDQNSPTGFSNDPNRFDRARGTVLRITLPRVSGTEYVGVTIEEPNEFGYDLRGAQRILFEARSPNPGGIDVQFGVGGRNTNRNTPFHLTDTFTTIPIEIASLRNPDTNQVSPPNLSDVHFLFSVVTSALYEQDGGTVLLDNIRFDPVPTNPTRFPRLSFPLGTESFGVVPAVIRAVDDGDTAFQVAGNWVAEAPHSGSYQGDRRTITGAAGAGVATWTFGGLQPRVYEVQATWVPAPTNATNATFTLFDGAQSRGTAQANQTQLPATSQFNGSTWKSLGLVRVESDILRVELSNTGINANSTIVADGVRIVPTIPPDQAIRNLSTIYEAALTIFALLDRGTTQDLTNARLIADTFLYALTHDSTGGGGQLPTAPDGSRGLRDSYSSGDIALLNNQGSGANDAQAGQVRLAGFSTDQRLAPPDGFALVLDGAFGGNTAFAIMGLLSAYRKFGDVRYLDGARELGRWIVGNLTDPNGPTFNSNLATQSFGGYFLGYPDQGVPKDRETSLIRGKSIENNGDIFAAFTQLANAERGLGRNAEADTWTMRANIAGDFVMALYDPGDPNNPRDGHFYPGTLYDPPGAEGPPTGPGLVPQGSPRGTDVANAALLLDSNTFTTLPLASSPRYRNFLDRNGNSIDWREPVRHIVDTYRQQITATTVGQSRSYTGYNIAPLSTGSQFRPGEPIGGLPKGIAWEFTAQVVVTMRFVDKIYNTSEFESQAQSTLNQIRLAQVSAPFGDSKGLVASTLHGENDVAGYPPLDQALGTPFQAIPERVGLAATTWAVFADANLNPFFTTTTTLTATSNPTTGGYLVTFTATVAPSPGNLGTVTFKENGTPMAGGANVPVVGGVATFQIATLQAGSHSVRADYSGATGFLASASNTLTLVLSSVPQVVSVTPNAGVTSLSGAQRSRVVNLTVVFDQAVQLDTNAITLVLHTTGVAYAGVPGQPTGAAIPTLTANPSADNKTWNVTFSGPNAEPPGSLDGLVSLKDGVYRLLIDAAKVHPLGAPTVNMAANSTTVFHRLFGDTNAPAQSGNVFTAVLTGNDNLAFRGAFNKPVGDGYLAYMDSNGDGNINSGDNLAFRGRFNKNLTWTV